MANEYLKRTPTSTGNRKVWTWSGWVKRNVISNDNQCPFSAGTDYYALRFQTTDAFRIINFNAGSAKENYITSQRFRDVGSWIHVLVTLNTTAENSSQRIKLYVNGAEITDFSTSNAPQANDDTPINDSDHTHWIGVRNTAGTTLQQYFQGEITDVFLVDGQALTPEVFGFYKDGNGYISVGSTQETDFRNGQWVPRTPREIKNLINDNGGFGVNGFYLPMNDSSNFGADFHTTPNSIITLKGENLPQPRNGAPDTTDAYVSQLRSDPYAANLVLAVPGISTSTSANLVTNGTFENETNGWTAQNSAISVNSNNQLVVDDSANAGSYSSANQTITTEVGKRYVVSYDLVSASGTSNLSVYSSGWAASAGDLAYTEDLNSVAGTRRNVSFTATTTSTTISLQTAGTSNSTYDNIVVKQEDAPRDYSADIKGSGTSKTLTAVGKVGVGYELGNYYGSAMQFSNDGTNGSGNADVINIPTSSDFVFPNDWTMECWMHPTATPSTSAMIVGQWQSGGGTNRNIELVFNTSRQLLCYLNSSGSNYNTGTSPALQLDQWYHVAVVYHGTNFALYVDGVMVSNRVNTPAATNTATIPFLIGSESDGSNGGDYGFNGYIQDVRVYKGIAKYKRGFDVPKPYTPVNFGGDSWRQVSDTCKNNFATLNPLQMGDNTGNNTYTNGNLRAQAGSNNQIASGNMGVNSGKWYWETRLYKDEMVGIFEADGQEPGQYPGQNAYGVSYHFGGGVYQNGSTSYGLGWAGQVYQVIGCALDVDNKRMYWHVNGVWANEADPETENGYWDYSKDDTGLSYVDTATHVVPGWRSRSTSASEQVSVNFGQNPTFGGEIDLGVTYPDSNGIGQFKYQPPSGYLAICSKNLPEPGVKNPGEHVKTLLWEGDGVKGRAITGLGFKPDLIWTYERTSTSAPYIIDSTIANDVWISTNGASTQGSGGNWLQSFDDDGFTLGTDGAFNQDGQTHIGWCWKAGGQQTTTNSDGSIMTEVSVNDDAGFSIVSWESVGSNTATRTVGHGLSSKPDFIILKNRDAAVNWRVYHHKLGTNGLALNSTEAAFSFWPSEPTDSIITLANSTTTGEATNYGNDTISAYCWREVEGYSKFGRFVGNEDAQGPFVYLGFKPALIMIKCDSSTSNWGVFDSSRHSSNPHPTDVYWNLNDTEYTSNIGPDFLSNGFKMRTTNSTWNGDGKTYVYAAWAEVPLKYANAK